MLFWKKKHRKKGSLNTLKDGRNQFFKAMKLCYPVVYFEIGTAQAYYFIK